MIVAALLAAATATVAATPSPEALELAHRVAASGFLATLGPLQTQSEVEDIVQQHPELSEAERTRLRAIGEERAAALVTKALDAEAQALAAALSLDDLRALAQFAASPAAQHQREVTPQVILATVQALGDVDYAGSVRAAFCAETRKLCEP